MNALAKCPWCGVEGVVFKHGDGRMARWEAGCDNPDCELNPRTPLKGTQEAAIVRWNRRV